MADRRVALVTGGTRGIGRAIALRLARDGADVVLNYRARHERAGAIVEVIESMGRTALPCCADVSKPDEVTAMFEDARRRLGHIDIVVNSAGGAWVPQDITDIATDHFRSVIADEIEATLFLLRAALPQMRERRWGRFVSIGGDMADDWRFGPPDAPLDYPLGKAARH